MDIKRTMLIGAALALTILLWACASTTQEQPPGPSSALVDTEWVLVWLNGNTPIEGKAVALHNPTDRALYVLTWHTPLEGMAGESMQVTRDGAKLPYQGILAKRGDPAWLDHD